MIEKNDVKRVRAKAKTVYHRLKTDTCFICGKDKKLELHHILPLSVVIGNWKQNNNNIGELNAADVDRILKEEPIIFEPENCITLCRVCHLQLHRLFGKDYNEKQVEKVKRYLTKTKLKFDTRRTKNG